MSVVIRGFKINDEVGSIHSNDDDEDSVHGSDKCYAPVRH